MSMTINCDMGEGFGLYRLGNDTAMMPLIDLANVACGFHASDPSIMHATVRLAKQHGVKVGAHPSLPDMQGFGRRAMTISPVRGEGFGHLSSWSAKGFSSGRRRRAKSCQTAWCAVWNGRSR